MKRKVNDGNLGLIAPSSKKQKKVDPETGEPSSASDAILYTTFRARQKVDPETGKPSSAANAISKAAYYKRKRRNETVASATEEPIFISDSISDHASQVQPLSSSQIGSFKDVKQEEYLEKEPLPMDLDVSDVSLREKIADVNKQSIISKDAGSDNCEVQAARLVWALQGKDISKVKMKNRGIEYTLPGNTNPWGHLHDSELVEENYEGLVHVTEFLEIDDDSVVSDMSHETCVTDVIQGDEIDVFFETMRCQKTGQFHENRRYCWGLMGLELGNVWHQVVWIEREDDIVICDPNRQGEKLLKHDQLKSSYANLARVSILQFTKGYSPLGSHVINETMQVFVDVKAENIQNSQRMGIWI